MGTSVSEFDPKYLIASLPSLANGAFRKAVEARLKVASQRELLRRLRPLAEMEAEQRAKKDSSLSRLFLERISCIKEVMSQLLRPEVFQPKYDRLLAQALKKRECECIRTKRLAYDTVPFVKIRQEAVGHGGFHHGVLATHYERTRWVYDCGSWRKLGRQSLEKCIDDFASQCKRDPGDGHIELLFVSHFDADHVIGLRRLLETVPGKTGTVVLPYLGSIGALAVLCEAAARGRCPRDLVDQVVDPVGWFLRFGALRVIQIRSGAPRSEGEAPPPPDLPPPRDMIGPPDTAGGLFNPVALGPDRKPIKTKRQKRGDKVRESATAPPGTVIAGTTPGCAEWCDWWFVPYVHPIPSKIRKNLSREAKRIVGVSVGSRAFLSRVIHLLSQKGGVKKLKEAYQRSGLNDANGISLSLYSGPRPSKFGRTILEKDGSRSPKLAGWLLTGDAKLRDPGGYRNWLQFFKPQQKTTGMLMLPHHGSDHNFNEAILAGIPGADLFITANADDESRPNKLVIEDAKKHRKKIRKVSELRRNGITEISGPTDYPREHFPYPDEW